MNPETERRLAAMIMEEANLMQQRAAKDGVAAYLAKPVVKARPNRQFLTAVVRSVQRANRMVDMEEMWRQREQEQENNKAARDKPRRSDDYRKEAERDHHAERRRNSNAEANTSGTDRHHHHHDDHDEGLKDEEVDRFLHSKVKRGRGAVGSRMDEPGPSVLLPALDSRPGRKKIIAEKSSPTEEVEVHVKHRREVKQRKVRKEKRKFEDSQKQSKKKRRHS